MPITPNSSSKSSLEYRRQALVRVYKYLISLDPLDKKTEPTTKNLSEEAVAGSNNENPSIHRDLSTCDEEQETGEGGISL